MEHQHHLQIMHHRAVRLSSQPELMALMNKKNSNELRVEDNCSIKNAFKQTIRYISTTAVDANSMR